MSKRPPQSLRNVTPKAKRPRPGEGGQRQLDSFFNPSPKKEEASTSKSMSNASEPIDVDALDSQSGASTPSAKTFCKAGDVGPSPQKMVMLLGSKTPKSDTLAFRPLDTDPAFYDPGSQPWIQTGAPYSFLAHTFMTLSQTRSRIVIVNSLTNSLVTLLERHPTSLLPSLYLLSNSLSPSYIGVELGIGSSVISKAIQQVSGLSAGALKQLYTTTGDAGDLAFLAKSNVRTLIPHPPLTIEQVYNSLLKIASCKGQGAAKQKERIVEKLLVAGSGEEVRYLVRTLTLNLRVGAVRTSILTALARAFVLHGCPKSQSQNHQSDSIYASRELLDHIQPLSLDSKRKAPEDPARESLKNLFEKAERVIKQVFVRHPCYDDIVQALLAHGFDNLADRVPLIVGTPLQPMLGSPTRSLDEVYKQLGDLSFTAEFKYDGQRAQIHARKETGGKVSVEIFSRHLENMTTKYPDVILLVECLLKLSPSVHSFIMDSEIVAVDPKTGQLKSFQELSGRARKDVLISEIRVPVALYAFDLMYYNEESLLSKPFRDRRRLLKSNFPLISPENDIVSMARFCNVESCENDEGLAAITEFLEKAVASQCEGLMFKVLDYEPGEPKSSIKTRKPKGRILPATYEPDKRTSAWLKLKKDYMEGIGDSLDLIPIGAWYGNGRKAGWWSPILLGLWNPETGKVVAVCKCMSGFTDIFYKSLLESYPVNSDTCSVHPAWECDLGGFRPDVYFKPREVWELRGADITESPVSVAARGLVSDTRGLSVRFPRFIQVRVDKGIEQASTPEFIADVWRRQQKRPAVAGVDEGDLIDVDINDIGDYDAEEDNSDAQDDS